MASIRVDGNDILAVHIATKKAREYSITNNKPVLIEAMSYRGGHHSTSDDSTRYRQKDEINNWNIHNNPITRFRLFLEHKKLWNNKLESELKVNCRKEVLKAMSTAENIKNQLHHNYFQIYMINLLNYYKDKLMNGMNL